MYLKLTCKQNNKVGTPRCFPDSRWQRSKEAKPKNGSEGSAGDSFSAPTSPWQQKRPNTCNLCRERGYTASQVVQWGRIYLPVQETQETWVRSLGQADPQNRKWQPTPASLPRRSRGQRSLLGYSPWEHKQSDMTEWLKHRELRIYNHI